MSSAARSANPDRSNRLILMGAVALAVLAAILVFVSLSNFSDSGSGSSLTGGINVVVASQDIKAGTKITSGMLGQTNLPSNAKLADAITDKSTLVGLTVRYPMAKGDQFSPAKVGQTPKTAGFAGIVPDGKRAVSVNVEEKTSVGGLIVAGDHVNVIVIGKAKPADAAPSDQDVPVSFVLLQNVEVLSVAQKSQTPVTRFDQNGAPIATDNSSDLAAPPSNTDATPKAKTVTLGVSGDEEAKLALAGQSYSIYLALRAPGDDSQITNPDNLQRINGVR